MPPRPEATAATGVCHQPAIRDAIAASLFTRHEWDAVAAFPCDDPWVTLLKFPYNNSTSPMKKQIVNISVLQSAKVMAVLYFVLSLPMVVLMGIPALMSGQGMSFGMLILMPVLYTLLGFVFTALGAWVYNIVASKMGGFEFTTSEVDSH
jgi:hypothetical protein